MESPWERPYECDEWKITTSYVGKTLIRRRPKFRATAVGYLDGEQHAAYRGVFGRVGHGSTREAAEADMRKIICDAIAEYENWLRERGFQTKNLTPQEICSG
jgi:hypothetical protein